MAEGQVGRGLVEMEVCWVVGDEEGCFGTGVGKELHDEDGWWEAGGWVSVAGCCGELLAKC